MIAEIFKECKFIFDILENAGFECYAVGGCVRDLLLGITPHDVDFTTDALPDEILSCFSDFETFELGKKFGTISVVNDGKVYEITTYRIDGAYLDSRHPDKVEFSSKLQDDLSRRDFTVNAMAMDRDGNIIDLFTGQEDLKNRIIRAVGEPDKRFSEDALRIIRALRFAARLNFKIDDNTAMACHKLCDSLINIHPQRIRDELSEIILSDKAGDMLNEYRDIFAVIIPELKPCFDFAQNTAHHRYDIYTHTLKALSISPKELTVRLSLLFHDIGKPLCHTKDKAGIDHFKGHPAVSSDIAMEILTRFCFPSAFVNRVGLLIKYHDKRFERLRPHIKRVLAELTYEEFSMLMTIQRCDMLAQSEYKRDEKLSLISNVEAEAKNILEENLCLRLKDLMVTGNDILNLGAEGKAVGDTLSHLLNRVIDDKLSNNYNDLIKEAKQYLNSH